VLLNADSLSDIFALTINTDGIIQANAVEVGTG
jgi:hypothetical protein